MIYDRPRDTGRPREKERRRMRRKWRKEELGRGGERGGHEDRQRARGRGEDILIPPEEFLACIRVCTCRFYIRIRSLAVILNTPGILPFRFRRVTSLTFFSFARWLIFFRRWKGYYYYLFLNEEICNFLIRPNVGNTSDRNFGHLNFFKPSLAKASDRRNSILLNSFYSGIFIQTKQFHPDLTRSRTKDSYPNESKDRLNPKLNQYFYPTDYNPIRFWNKIPIRLNPI